MKLIDLLVKELPKRGGWPSGVAAMAQDANGAVQNYRDTYDIRIDYQHAFGTSRIIGSYSIAEDEVSAATDRLTSIITRAQYEASLAANDGWLEWGGGECPVETGTLVDIRIRNGKESHGVRANESTYRVNPDASYPFWRKDGKGGDIIAYRLHKPDINSRANDDRLEQDLNECIGQDVDMPEWSGDGLPPVGTVCEAKVPRPITGWEWRKVKVVESGIPGAEKEALVYDLETTSPSWADEFRPLRNEAEKAREDAETAMRTCLAGTGAGITPLAAKGIYEAIAAGKIHGVKLEKK